jgi:nitroimidazol reductase NimA-like FMN-containing flavoprotein (pyridoxamine 5'-phosphate oxidase superfamily)
MLEILTNEESTELLRKKTVGRLGCVLESGEPYVMPINYIFEDGVIACYSVEGLKLMAMRANGRACVQVDEIEDTFQWKSVIAFGDYEEVRDSVVQKHILDTFQTRFSSLTPAVATRHERTTGDVVVFRINVKRLTGRMER